MSMQDSYFITGKLSDDCKSFVFDHGDQMSRFLSGWKEADLMITLEKLKFKRSNAQNRYLHGVVLPTIQRWTKENTGETLSYDSIKSYIYIHILGNDPRIDYVHGKEVIVLTGKHFSEMSTVEFMEAKGKVQLFYGELGLEIKDPINNNTLNDFI